MGWAAGWAGGLGIGGGQKCVWGGGEGCVCTVVYGGGGDWVLREGPCRSISAPCNGHCTALHGAEQSWQCLLLLCKWQCAGRPWRHGARWWRWIGNSDGALQVGTLRRCRRAERCILWPKAGHYETPQAGRQAATGRMAWPASRHAMHHRTTAPTCVRLGNLRNCLDADGPSPDHHDALCRLDLGLAGLRGGWSAGGGAEGGAGCGEGMGRAAKDVRRAW